MKFLDWYNNADMPQKQQNGIWVDLETGLTFNPAQEKVKQFTLSQKAEDARNLAKSFGGKALTGTAKQKEWAEKIRASKLKNMAFEHATLVCDKNGLLNNSKFWIENRDNSAEEIAQFIIEQKSLLAKFNKSEKGTDEARSLADQYNALTAKWF
ncbi:hypothetical protein OZX61_12875 (plasmid) [Acinetobacter sp. ESL0695]|uniref:hypothetical protein n=1 Tax=Acinetobacter sp. ESL0695 TaxID=2983215 RepID=UPI0023F33221|nr:hypothetical protein [Acinetobacter sp. ESL0695]WEV50235.1 hypothetical protein OZX61_12875 [Acinetobacter sp. ESL0695]